MAGEFALSPSQVKRDGIWRPIRHNTKSTPSLRSYPLGSTPPRKSSLRAFRGQRPLAAVQEYKAASIETHSTGTLDSLTHTHHPTSWKSSSEQLVLVSESPQLQQIQSVSMSFPEDSRRSESVSSLYGSQSQWARPPPSSDVLSGIPASESSPSLGIQCTLTPETAATSYLDDGDSSKFEVGYACAGEDLPREDIAELFHRVEEYEGKPEVVRESGKVWVRVNSVSHGLSRTLKTVGSLRKKKPSFEARLGPNVPVYSQLKCYEKPSRIERFNIGMHDCWRRFRNWSTGRDTALQAKNPKPPAAAIHPMMNVSLVSPNKTPSRDTRPQMGQRRLSRAPRLEGGWDAIAYSARVRKDSKHSIYNEPLKRRRSSLFLDIYSTDDSITG